MRKAPVILFGLALGSVLLLAILAGALLLVRTLHPTWPDTVPGVKFDPRLPPLRAADLDTNNAAFYLVSLTNVVSEDVADAVQAETRELLKRGWSEGANPALERWLDQPSVAREAWNHAGAMSYAQMPTLNSLTELRAYLSPFLKLAKLAPASAERAAAHGEWEEMVRVYRAALANAGHVSRGGVLLDHLIALAADGIVCQSVRRVAARQDIPPAVSGEVQVLLRQRAETMEPLAEAYRYERALSLPYARLGYKDPDAVASVLALSGETRLGWWIRNALGLGIGALVGSSPDRTARHMDAMYSLIIDAADASGENASRRSVDAYLAERGWRIWFDDPVGHILVRILVPTLDAVAMRKREVLADLQGAMVFLSVRQYQLQHEGTPPPDLARLVPQYLDTIPADPLDPQGAPLRYRVQGARWTVYSVGRDGKDDGGMVGCARSGDPQENCDLLFASDEFTAP